MLLEQAAIDVGKSRENFRRGFLAFWVVRIEYEKEAVEHVTKIGTIFGGVIFDQVLHRVLGLEDAGVVGEQTEQQPDEEDFRRETVFS